MWASRVEANMAQPDGRPPHVRWDFDRAELALDGVVHWIGLGLGAVGIIFLVAWAANLTGAVELTSVLIYGTSLLAALGVSTAYNMWPVTPVKWLLRRIDHSAIYVLIAGTYTPFMTQISERAYSVGLLIWIWTMSLFGVVLKLVFPGRFDRLSVALYLLLGWSGVMAYEALSAALPTSTLFLLVAGGVLYSTGVVFHAWQSLRFHNAIWHAFVLLAAGCHYGAVLDALVLTRA
jgi:hemolysin III